MGAATFFGNLNRRCDGMKMEWQEKYREQQQQADSAETPGGADSGAIRSHEALNTQVNLTCQSQVRFKPSFSFKCQII
jgi:hypothetical protein